MSKTIAYAGALAAALLVVSTGPAAAQSAEGTESGSISLPGSAEDTGGDPGQAEGETGPLGSAGDLIPGSVTGSLPGYATGPIGSVGNAACNVGTIVSLVGTVTGIPIPVPISAVCTAVRPLAESADSLVQGDVQGSVDTVVGGVPVVGNSLEGQVDTSSVADEVEGSVGDRLGSLEESSLAPGN